LPSHRRLRASVAVLAILLFAFTTMVAASHTEASHSECPICQIANLPLIKPAEVVQLAPLQVVERQATVTESIQEREASRTSGPPRAPPAS
jgi:hypothetical protein